MNQGIERLFRDRYARDPEGSWQSPGRINLIGEHTDYNEGFVLPFAIDRRLQVAAARHAERYVRVASLQQPQVDEMQVARLVPGDSAGWARYVFGVLWSFERAGVRVPGVDLVVDSAIPLGAGLSSSAALLAAVAVAMNDLCGFGFDIEQLAAICHRAESEFVGVPVGRMDQTAVLGCREGHALLLDCRSGEARQIPLDIGPVLVVDTRVRHDNAGGAYAARRLACERAASILGLDSLRDATLDVIEASLDGELLRVARHVVTENARVIEAVRRLESGLAIGELLLASHESLRFDYRVSCGELDCAVDVAMGHGASGARLTGAGLGGCAIVVGGDFVEIESNVSAEFARRRFTPPRFFEVTPSDGAGRLRGRV